VCPTRTDKFELYERRNELTIELFGIGLVGFVHKPLHYPPSRKGIMKKNGIEKGFWRINRIVDA
jgi:hypothetical protein